MTDDQVIKTTKRRQWHRSEDRWEWIGLSSRWSSPTKPEWFNEPGTNIWYFFSIRAQFRRSRKSTSGQRFDSLRRIPPPSSGPAHTKAKGLS